MIEKYSITTDVKRNDSQVCLFLSLQETNPKNRTFTKLQGGVTDWMRQFMNAHHHTLRCASVPAVLRTPDKCPPPTDTDHDGGDLPQV